MLKTDPTYKLGFPDLLVLYKDRWAALEVKRSARASKQPLQDFYVDQCAEMSFGAFVYPENEQEVLHDLQRSFETRG